MNRSLWLLLALQTWGWARWTARGLRTVKGALLALLGAIVFIPWVLALLLTPAPKPVDPELLRRAGPAALLFYCLLSGFLTAGEGALYFAPAEVSVLFPAPLSRRQLLLYKIATTILIGLPTSLFLSLVFHSHAGSLLSCFVALALVYVFLQLVAMGLQLAATALGATLVRRGRLLLLGIVPAAILAILLVRRVPDDFEALFAAAQWVQRQPFWELLTRPLLWFIEAFLARTLADLWPPALLAAGFNIVLFLGVLLLDRFDLEATAASSARIHARIQRLRGRESGGEAEIGGTAVRISLPPFPNLGGIGTIAWRQLLTAFRNPGKLVLLAIPMFMLLAGPVLAHSQDRPEAAKLAAPLGVFILLMPIFFSTLAPFDFRGDIDRLAVLKTFPLPGWRLALGQVVAPVAIVCFYQWALLLGVGWVTAESSPSLLLVAALAPPFNFFLFALENLLFLLFPARLQGGDFQSIGRNVVLMLGKSLAMGMTLALAAGFGAVVYFFTERLELAVAMGWCILVAAGLVLVPLLALAFDAFDVSRDTPA